MNSPPASGTARSHTKHTGEQRFRRRAREAMTRHAPPRAKGGPKPLRQTDVLRLAGNRSDLRSARNIPGMTRSNQMASIATRCNRSMEEEWAAQPRIMRTIPSAPRPRQSFFIAGRRTGNTRFRTYACWPRLRHDTRSADWDDVADAPQIGTPASADARGAHFARRDRPRTGEHHRGRP